MDKLGKIPAIMLFDLVSELRVHERFLKQDFPSGNQNNAVYLNCKSGKQ